MKVIVKGGVILSLLLFVFACNSGYEKTPFEGKQFRIDTLHIKVPENRSPTLANLTVQEFMGNEYLIGFNFQTYSIDYYDLKGFEFVKSIRLTKEGPNFVSGVSAFCSIT